MDKVQLKSGIHAFIDEIDNVELLREYYMELKKLINSGKSGIWDSLSKDQKKEIFKSYEESEIEENLVDENVVMEKYHKWITK
ncbi:MAG: hypothetical protein HQ522_21015 [Bacteroidetes bacterium]|nr:hypothetical protein [Bacteroidota bacterium]